MGTVEEGFKEGKSSAGGLESVGDQFCIIQITRTSASLSVRDGSENRYELKKSPQHLDKMCTQSARPSTEYSSSLKN